MARTKMTRRLARPPPPPVPPVIVKHGIIAYSEFQKLDMPGDADCYDAHLLTIEEAREHLAMTSLGAAGWAREFLRLVHYEVRKSELFKQLPAELVKKIVGDLNAVA